MDEIRKEVFTEELYSTMSWNKKLARKFKQWFEDNIINFKMPWKKLIALGVFALIVLGLYIIVKANQVTLEPRDEYNKNDFLDSVELSNQYGDELSLESDSFEFVLNTKDTLFVIKDKRTGEEFSSNPDSRTSRFLQPIRIFYAGNLGSVNQISVYDQAIDYDDFLVKVGQDYLEVLYLVGGKKEIDANDFPQIITDERMQDIILSKLEEGSIDYRRITEQAYVFGEVNGVSIWKLKDGIQRSILQRLYEIMYVTCGYTEEDLIYDQESNGIKIEDKYPYFEISIRYSLDESGFNAQIINDSIVEKEKYPLLYVDLLPYFGAGTLTDEGYLFVPDGSGGIIEFNQQRSFALPYNKRIYGRDLASFELIKTEEQSKISLPVLGIKNNQGGFIAIAENAAEMANIYANGSTQENPYNQAFYRYNIREGQVFEFASINSSVSINEWTASYNIKDFNVKYLLIDETDVTYVDMAHKYREYLLEEEMVETVDSSVLPVLDLTLLGGYMVDENFLGIPYRTVRSLTNVNQAKEIISKLDNTDLENINIYYQGFANQGLKPAYMGDISFDSETGNSREFKELLTYSEEIGIEMFLEAYVNTAYTKKNINLTNSVIRDVFGEVVYNYDYNPASLFIDGSSRERYVLKPYTYVETLNELDKIYKKVGAANIAYSDFGNNAYGSYKKGEVTFRYDTITAFEEAIKAYSFSKTMLRNPNLYAMKYASNITDVEMNASNYQIIAYSIPFYQLVFSGLIDYSGKPFNTNDEYSYQYHTMKAIETAANISMMWSYESTVDLLETEYSHYYSTYYEYWLETLTDTYDLMNSLDIYAHSLVDHEILTKDGLVSKSRYSNGIIIVFNYRDYPYADDDYVVAANDFLVVEEVA